MPILFDDDEDAYLSWINDNPDGFVVNVDRKKQMSNYPMIHSSRHGLIASPEIGNFTTGDYIKICSADRTKLEEFCKRMFERPLVACRSQGCL